MIGSVMRKILEAGAYAGRKVGIGAVRSGAGAISIPLAILREKDRPLRRETFDQAVLRQNLTEADIVRRRRELNGNAKAGLVFAAGILAYAFYLAATRESALDLIGAVNVFLFSALPATLFLKNGFRVWQIRQRRLGSFREYLDNPQEWLRS